ncbi:alcohol dehydrogenase AdhP [Pelagibius sp.]|uniref:alcohol dehydrogenase AdhP n=1 Tax=Pelagibius sp. TaxID=1931238 RepID=UPI003BAF9BFB
MPSTMKAAVVTEFGKPLDIREVDKPEVSDGKIVVKIEASGVCHTDLHAAQGDWPVKPTPPFIPGHEGVGSVAAVGRGVTSVKEGDRVGVPWLHTACGCCRHCVGGWETLCESQANTGYSVNGGFADYVLADPDYVGHLPDGLDFAPAAPILCAGVTVYKGLKETEAKPGQTVAVVGIGGLGQLAVQYAKAMGFHVIAIDIAEEKLKMASDSGADQVFNAATTDAAAEIAKNGGVEGVVVTAVSRDSFSQAVTMLGRGGTMSLIGLPPGGFELPIFEVVLMRKTIRGSIVGTRNDLSEALQFAAEGKVASHFATDRLENVNDIFGRMEAGKIDGRIVMEI